MKAILIFLICSFSFTASAATYSYVEGVGFVLKGAGQVKRYKKPKNPCGAKLNSKGRQQYLSFVVQAANAVNISPALLDALILCESNYQVSATSSKGAFGLTQLMEPTAVEIGADRHSPLSNISGGAFYLSQLLKRFNQSERLALAAYNAGAEKVEKYNGVPPFMETQRYVANVLKLKTKLDKNEYIKYTIR